MGSLGDLVRSVFSARGDGGDSFEAASRSRRLRNFNPSRRHINAAIQGAGKTLLARIRFVYENDGLIGNIVDEWTSAAVGTGIKPRPRFKGGKDGFLEAFADWTDECDADGLSDYYGIQERVAREAYLAGEVFVRLRRRRLSDMAGVPLQLQIIPSEQLDLQFNQDLGNGRHIRAGIEFDALNKRAAYHFYRSNPTDSVPGVPFINERTRVPADQVLHIFDPKHAGQIRGTPRLARSLVKAFTLESYDDAELDRKRNAALFSIFLVGRGENPVSFDPHADGEEEEEEEDGIAPLEPGAIIDLGDDKDIRQAEPADSGASYEPFQYRTYLKICAGAGVPYAVASGDVTRGNFSNVRTAIIQFRRRVSQWQFNTLVFQFCRPVMNAFVEVGIASGRLSLPGYDANPAQFKRFEHLPPAMEWIDPEKDVNAEIKSIRAGLKTRTQSVAERGYDREEVDAEFEEERKDEEKRELIFDTNAKSAKAPSGLSPADSPGRKAEPDPSGDKPDSEDDTADNEESDDGA